MVLAVVGIVGIGAGTDIDVERVGIDVVRLGEIMVEVGIVMVRASLVVVRIRIGRKSWSAPISLAKL